MFDNKNIAQFAKIETPFYYYDLQLLTETLNACAMAAAPYDYHVHYALKANFNQKVLEQIKNIGFGADCVSSGEVKRAVEVGFHRNKVVFAGVGKSDKEINEALDLDIFCFNVESVQ
ncbi:MAG: diaminopimelate decarboxylase, partial [Pedobacter sp.]